MSCNFSKLTLIFVTHILFTDLQVRQHVAIAELELAVNNLTLQQLFPSPLIFKGNLTQVFEDAHVVGYVDEWVEPTVGCPFELSSKIWNYVKKTYGKFGDDGHLYVLLHSSKTNLQNGFNLDIQFLLSTVTFPPNVVECVSDSSWKEINEFDGILCLARQVSDLVMAFAKETVDTDFLRGMRKNGRDDENKWHSIFIYDFLLKCGQKQLAASYLNTTLAAFSSSKHGTKSYWMRDWFFPIYSRYGGAYAMNAFFETSAEYFPRKLNTKFKICYWQYERRMTAGEFVHFWSGAANVNLRDQFSKIVYWDVDYKAQLRKAQLEFPQMKYLFYQPQINRTGRTHRQYFDVGDTDFKLYCEAHGIPHPKIEWKKQSNHDLERQHQFFTQVTQENGTSVLSFSPMEKSFYGTYTCYASNQHGSDSYDYYATYTENGIEITHGIRIAAGFILMILPFVVFRFLWFFFIRNKRSKDLSRDLSQQEVHEFKNGRGNQNNSTHIHGEGQIKIHELPFDNKFIINPNDLMIEKGVILGQGYFGIVHRGLLNGDPVAVKTLKSTADVTFVKGLLSELKIMSFIGDHAHIIHFYGAVIEKIQKRVVEAVVELSPLGNLLDYLRKLGLSSPLLSSQVNYCNLLVNDAIPKDTTQELQEAITTLDLIDWCRQIASGMDFISSKRVYHGDLAARNILMFPNKKLKITDFGFAKQLYSSPLYVKKQKIALPWRWMSLESLRFMEFSIQSDVWAFGVTMWEIFSLGQTPYPGLTWSPEFIKILTTGMRMARPDYCPKLLYDQMLQCWDTNQEKRPQFIELVQFFDHLLQPFCPFGDTNQRRTMQEMNTMPTASTNTSSTKSTCSSPYTVDGQGSDVVYTVL